MLEYAVFPSRVEPRKDGALGLLRPAGAGIALLPKMVLTAMRTDAERAPALITNVV
jgi:hypothetical protein